MRTIGKLLIGIAILSLVYSVNSCQMITSNDLQKTVTTMSLSKTIDTIDGTASDVLSPMFEPYGAAANITVTWASSDSRIVTVNSSGLVTGVSPGVATITATTNDQSKSASCTVTVALVKVTGISLNKTVDAMSGSETLIATVLPANATNKNITWTSSNTSVATVSASGVVTSQSAGSTNVTAATVDQNLIATCSITVPYVPVTGVTLNFTSNSMPIGSYNVTNGLLGANVSPANATNKNVTWTSSNPAVATISVTGGEIFLTCVSPGTSILTATTVDQGKTATLALTCTATNVTGVILNKSTDMISGTGTDTLIATIAPSSSTNQNVTWVSSNTSVATVSSSGVITGVNPGQAVITIITADGGYTASCNVTVLAVSITEVSLNKSTDTIPLDGTDALTATIMPSNAINQNVTWTSSNTAVATVSATGVVTGILPGQSTVTVTTSVGGYTASCAITITGVAVTSVSLNKSTDTFQVNGSDTMMATILPSNATNKNVTWTSSNASIATVNSSGVIMAITPGTATITVVTVDQNKSATCTVTLIQLVNGVSITHPAINHHIAA